MEIDANTIIQKLNQKLAEATLRIVLLEAQLEAAPITNEENSEGK